MSTFKGLYDIRDAQTEDKNFVIATFLRGLYYGNTWFKLIPKDIFMNEYKTIVEALVNISTIKIACLKEDTSVILGYSILSNDYQIVHWVYVKKSWRNNGIANTLVPERPASFSHLSDLGKILMSKYEHTIFNPFKLT